MAIDSRAKRESALLDAGGMLHPDGTIGTSDRLALIGQYSGIAAASPAVIVPLIITTPGAARDTVTRGAQGGLTRGGGRG